MRAFIPKPNQCQKPAFPNLIRPNIIASKALRLADQSLLILARLVDIGESALDLLGSIPYQTLVSSILHKYVEGRFVEKDDL